MSVRTREAHSRSFVKAVSWRLTGSFDTFVLSFLITGNFRFAGLIAVIELLTKIVIYYLHERAWSHVQWGQPLGSDHGREAHSRSLAKAVSWRLTGSLDTFILSFLVTGSFKYAGSIAVTEMLTKIVLYYLHERAWSRIRWGKPQSAEPAGLSVPDQPTAARS